jgi:nucleotide-binding universal stress UspA family protein
LESELVKFTEYDFQPVVQEATRVNKTIYAIKHKVEKGKSFHEAVQRFARRNRSGLIVLGTKGVSGLKKYVIGSNAASLIEISHIPVLAVPERAEYKGFKNVVYATDLKHIEKELATLIPWVREFGSNLHILHVMKKGDSPEVVKDRISKAWQRAGYEKITVAIKQAEAIDMAIEGYVKQVKAELIAMFTDERTMYQKLFDRSITKKMAFQSRVPLLAFKRS